MAMSSAYDWISMDGGGEKSKKCRKETTRGQGWILEELLLQQKKGLF